MKRKKICQRGQGRDKVGDFHKGKGTPKIGVIEGESVVEAR